MNSRGGRTQVRSCASQVDDPPSCRVPVPHRDAGPQLWGQGLRRNVTDQFVSLLPDGFAHVTTPTMAFLMNGYSIKYIDIQYSRRCGQSRFHWRVGSKRYVVQVTRMVMM